MESPTANGPTPTPTSPPYLWVGEPTQRTTFGIISFCFSTLIICVWSTIHFSVPRRRQSTTRSFFLQVEWMFIALLAPEILLYLALSERTDAGRLVESVRKYDPELVQPGMIDRLRNYIRGRVNSSEKEYNATGQTSFSLVHAFYRAMEGFVFDKCGGDNALGFDEGPYTSTRFIVAPSSLTFFNIMKYFPHLITDISEESILDRASSSSLSKALLIAQSPRGFDDRSCLLHFDHLLCVVVESVECRRADGIEGERGSASVRTVTFTCDDSEYDEALEMARAMAAGRSSTLPEGRKKIIIAAANALQRLLPNAERPPPRRLSPVNERFPGSRRSWAGRN